MFLLEIAGVKILYTGDYSREEDRHLMPAERPPGTVEVMICESTFGVQSHEPRVEREARFTSAWSPDASFAASSDSQNTETVQDIVMRRGRCLIPTFALGRAQELLLILDEYWSAHPELHQIPVYYASALAKKCMAVYQTYTNMMNNRVKRQIAAGNNPFVFKHISNLKGRDAFDDSGPCVMMASPGMLQVRFTLFVTPCTVLIVFFCRADFRANFWKRGLKIHAMGLLLRVTLSRERWGNRFWQSPKRYLQ